MTDLAKLVVRLEAEIGKYQENLDKANKQLKKFSDDADSRLTNLAGVFAAFFTVDRLRAWGERIVENADQVGKLSQRTGVAVENLSKLLYTFDQGGINAESFTMLMKELNKSLAEAAGNADSEAGRAFRMMGIEIRGANGEIIKADQALEQISDRFAGYADGANKGALATALLGKNGEAAIPVLNGGAEGLRRMGDEAERLGAVISGDLANQAAEFNDRLDRLQTLLIEGIGNRVAAELLPTLNSLGDQFEETADKSLLLERISGAVATAIKALTDVGLGASTAFVKLGNAIGGTAAAAVAVAEGDFSRAGDIIEQVTADNLQIEADYQKARAALWKDGGEEILREVEITAKKIQEQAPNLAGGKVLEDAIKKATDKLKGMQQDLRAQVETFGLGEAALVKYRLEMGDLAEVVKSAGEGGRELAASIVAQAEALQQLKDTKEVADALADINQQILQLSGDEAGAAIAEFDRKNAELVTKLRQTGNTEGLKQLDTLTKLIVAQADFNALTQDAVRIQTDLGLLEDRIRNSRESGAITELDMQAQLSEARKKAADDLAAINAEQQAIADQTGNPAMIENVKQLGGAIEQLRAQTDLLGQSLRNGFEDAFGDSLKGFIKGTQSASDAFQSFVEDVGDQLLDLATQFAAQQLFGAIAGLGGGGGTGGAISALAGIFAGGRASGGDVHEGMAYRINENTPNSEWFVPKEAGSVVPASKLGGKLEVNNTFVLPPNGRISLETQQQIATRTQNALAFAQRRNA